MGWELGSNADKMAGGAFGFQEYLFGECCGGAEGSDLAVVHPLLLSSKMLRKANIEAET